MTIFTRSSLIRNFIIINVFWLFYFHWTQHFHFTSEMHMFVYPKEFKFFFEKYNVFNQILRLGALFSNAHIKFFAIRGCHHIWYIQPWNLWSTSFDCFLHGIVTHHSGKIKSNEKYWKVKQISICEFQKSNFVTSTCHRID